MTFTTFTTSSGIVKKSGWYTAYFCASCKARLSQSQVYYSSGRCPLCGFKGSVSVVKVIERAAREVITITYPENYRWWKFWRQPQIQTTEEFLEEEPT